ncbi:MAG TPA: response regulator [Sulfurovum sp.]|jgi:putative two-component system response regulator|nr:MAG: response regulator [Sulfurovum sp. 35-42-20]OYZ25497.1 MAG: response regulator [Sulfurovum sp. 16-42-52]OYZ48835.1 MAG: response regulator [Sulfurovum sp. 24-42-9]OZA59352.1 MAG: response regulator [Sulfurovum sp. 39-42-12]HQR73567.1 response regulator [Sulfurovum sp.]
MALKVLVVDDDFINRKLLQTLLKKNPMVTDIIEAENGSDALDKLKKDPTINLVLLDIMMPVVDGIEFLKIFRSEMTNAHIPVIVLSTDDTRKTEVFDNGANDFLRKPVMQDKLTEKIAQWTV